MHTRVWVGGEGIGGLFPHGFRVAEVAVCWVARGARKRARMCVCMYVCACVGFVLVGACRTVALRAWGGQALVDVDSVYLCVCCATVICSPRLPVCSGLPSQEHPQGPTTCGVVACLTTVRPLCAACCTACEPRELYGSEFLPCCESNLASCTVHTAGAHNGCSPPPPPHHQPIIPPTPCNKKDHGEHLCPY
jgi:hypothetical protein